MSVPARARERIMRDIGAMAELNKEADGLYYFFDEADIMTGYGLIIGSSGTPYEGGFYLISFQFPDTYPFNPPLCKHLSFCDRRQSPNFHDNGTICLTRLNTWDAMRDGRSADRWTPIMNIHSVLQMIQAQVLTSNPLNNEPPYNYSETHPEDNFTYSELVRYCNLRHNVVDIYYKTLGGMTILPPSVATDVSIVIKNHLREHGSDYIKAVSAARAGHAEGTYLQCTCYHNSSVCLMYDLVEKYLTNILIACGGNGACLALSALTSADNLPGGEKIKVRLKPSLLTQ